MSLPPLLAGALRLVGDRNQGRLRHLPPDLLRLVRDLWMRLIDEGRRLLHQGPPGLRLPSISPGDDEELMQSIPLSTAVANAHLDTLPVATDAVASSDPCPLKIGMGNFGATGCLDRYGRHVLWRRLTGHQTSAQTAMAQLGLFLLGMPGARLSPSFALPASSGLGDLCSGRPVLRERRRRVAP